MMLNRRNVLAGGLAVAVTGAVDLLFTGSPALAHPGTGYGDLVPDPAGLLDLPRGFRYRVLSREGTPMADGAPVPSRPDGMAVFADRRHGSRLVRNHENRPGVAHPVAAPATHTFDRAAAGGTTTLVVGADNRLVEEYTSLGGTAVNCAGGPTPWDTWLTCEETEARQGANGYEKDHGWIFEVDPHHQGRNATPVPLTAMGRFAHEATCVDPHTGVVYETEDAAAPFGGLYRFLPNRPRGGHGSLRAGGTLQAMRVPDVPDLSVVQEPGTRFDRVEWVTVPDPLAVTTSVRKQDYGPAGITHAQKLEGAWWGEDRAVYFVSSFAQVSSGAGAEHRGQVWRYDPVRRTLTLTVVFHGEGDAAHEYPDNICMTPFGGLMLCQDGDGENYLTGTTRAGRPYPFARNAQNLGTPTEPAFAEFAGVGFSADGRTMFVNCYSPGTTFAVWGPWAR
ncbi:alkaline phosphatase PhoX [Longispora urticae]